MLEKRDGLQLEDNVINMDIAAHAGEAAALQDARKQRYFLPHPGDKHAARKTSDVLHDLGVHHDTICLTDLHSDVLLDTSTTPAVLGNNMNETLREDPTMLSTEPVLVASPTASDSDSSTPATIRPKSQSLALPSKSILDEAANLPVVDARGQAIPFNELYRVDPGQQRRIMIIFIRHFFCGVGIHAPVTDIPTNGA